MKRAISRRETLAVTSAFMLASCASSPVSGLGAELAALDAATGARVGHRAGERFGMCSTFKLPLAAVILREADAGRLSLEAPVAYTQADMVFYAPVAQEHLAEGSMTVGALAEATQKTSDNVAANLLLRLIGGPAGFTAKLREMGDRKTRLDRFEPAMNLVPTGDVRDTTTPDAMAGFVADIMKGSVLTPPRRNLLFSWMVDTRTGAKRLRAGLPPEWPAGDKTGTADHESMPNKVNDVAVAWPLRAGERHAPLVIAAYYEAPGSFLGTRDVDQAVLAEVGRLVGAWAASARG